MSYLRTCPSKPERTLSRFPLEKASPMILSTDPQMSLSSEYLNMIYDPLAAALNGWDIIPTVIMGLGFGVLPIGRKRVGLKAVLVLIISLIYQAVKPISSGLGVTWPDIMSFEGLIGLGLLFVAALTSVAVASFLRHRLNLDDGHLIQPLR